MNIKDFFDKFSEILDKKEIIPSIIIESKNTTELKYIYRKIVVKSKDCDLYAYYDNRFIGTDHYVIGTKNTSVELINYDDLMIFNSFMDKYCSVDNEFNNTYQIIKGDK